jgi:hypothetical protein
LDFLKLIEEVYNPPTHPIRPTPLLLEGYPGMLMSGNLNCSSLNTKIMAYKFKLIKSKDFEVKGVKHQHHTVAYKGRVLSINTMRWEGDMEHIKVDTKDNSITVNCDVDVLQRVDVDGITGETKAYLDLMPKCNLALAAF